ncbi:MAG: TonB-dependent receptor, partial [Proteobacteria bacterium]|nr:TonB-dependent receptor [Pseudomonadota bacterium]
MRFLFIVLCLLFVAVPSARAQLGVSVIKGTVIDAVRDEPIVGARVSVRSPNLQGTKRATTDRRGRFRIANLPPGDYTVLVHARDYRPSEHTGIQLRTNTTVKVDGTLLSAKEDVEEIEVQGMKAPVDVGSAQNMTTITPDFAQHIPMASPASRGGLQRSFESIALMAPQAGSGHRGTAISGTTAPENLYLVDGLGVGGENRQNQTALSIDFVDQLNVITSGYLPEYGRATGGVLNATTKSGSNEHRGAAWFTLSPPWLEAGRKYVKPRASTIVHQSELASRWDLGGAAGGPILLDKLWYYVGFDIAFTTNQHHRALHRFLLDPMTGARIKDTEGEPLTEEIPGTRVDYQTRDHNLQLLGKLTYSPNSNNRLAASFITTPWWPSRIRSGNPYVDADQQQRYTSTYQLTFKWDVNSDDYRKLLNTTLGIHQTTFRRLPLDGSRLGEGATGIAATPNLIWSSAQPRSITAFESYPGLEQACASIHGELPCPAPGYSVGGRGFMYDGTTNRLQLTSMGTLIVPDFYGEHVIKAGIDLQIEHYQAAHGETGLHRIDEHSSGDRFTSNGPAFLLSPDEPSWITWFSRSAANHLYGAFLQDSWHVSDPVTVNLGLRYDMQFMLGKGAGQGLTLPSQIAPRIGVIWDPSEEGKARIFANYGRFFHSMPVRSSLHLLHGQPWLRGYHLPATGYPNNCDLNAFDSPNACYESNPTYRYLRNGRSDPNLSTVAIGSSLVPIDASLTAQYNSEISLGAEYNLFGLARVGATYTHRWLNNLIETMSLDETQTIFLGNPGRGLGSGFAKGVRNYHALTLAVTKPMSSHWLLQANYTLASLRGNYSGLVNTDSGQFEPNMNSDFDVKDLLVNRYGPLSGDVRHTFKAYGAYILTLFNNHEINIGTALNAHSGRPTNYLGSHELLGSRQVFILPRGS